MTNKIDLIIDGNEMKILQSFTDIKTNVRYKTLDEGGKVITITIVEMKGKYIDEFSGDGA